MCNTRNSRPRPLPVIGQTLIAVSGNPPTVDEAVVTYVGRKYFACAIKDRRRGNVRFRRDDWCAAEGILSCTLYASREDYEDAVKLREQYRAVVRALRDRVRSDLSDDAIHEMYALITGETTSLDVVRLARVAMDLRRYGDPEGRLGRAYDALTEALDKLSKPQQSQGK